MKTRLILVDGLSGTGKSTAATHLALCLQEQGVPYRYYWELEVPHPINTRSRLDGRDLKTAELVELGVANWRAFADYARERDTVTVFDGKPFHISVMNMALQDRLGPEQAADYIARVAEAVRELEPKAVYLRQPDIAAGLEKIEAERGRGWIADLVSLVEEGKPFGGGAYAGVEGALRFLEDYRARIEAGLAAAPLDKLVVDTAAGDWAAYYSRIRDFVGLAECATGDAGNRHLGGEAQDTTLLFDNRSGRPLTAYRLPFKERWPQYAFEMPPAEVFAFRTQFGERFRLYDTNSGAVRQDVIACRPEQDVVIRAAGERRKRV